MSLRVQAVALHDQQEFTHEEIASVLGISVANSRVLVHRGHAALRRLVEANCVVSIGSDPVPCERREPPAQTFAQPLALTGSVGLARSTRKATGPMATPIPRAAKPATHPAIRPAPTTSRAMPKTSGPRKAPRNPTVE